jgi:hypothetical protein
MVDAILPIFSIDFQCEDLLVTRKRCVVCHQRNAAATPAHTTMIDTGRRHRKQKHCIWKEEANKGVKKEYNCSITTVISLYFFFK